MKLIDINPPQQLQSKILARINKSEIRMARALMALMGLFSISSIAGIVFAVRYTAEELSQSGFSQYLSLLFSDSGTLVTVWKEFAFSIADSIPIVGIIIALSSIAVFLASAKAIIINTPKIKHTYGY